MYMFIVKTIQWKYSNGLRAGKGEMLAWECEQLFSYQPNTHYFINPLPFSSRYSIGLHLSKGCYSKMSQMGTVSLVDSEKMSFETVDRRR